MPITLTMLRRLLPIAVLLTLGIPGAYAQLDCGHPVDVRIAAASQANVTFQGTSGETVYIRLLANSVDPGFTLNAPVVADPFGNVLNARARSLNPAQFTAGATPIDLAGGVQGENFTGGNSISTPTATLPSRSPSNWSVPTRMPAPAYTLS